MSIKVAEAAIIAKIKALVGNTVRAVESLPGDWDDDTLKRLLRLVPGVFIAWAGGPAKELGGNDLAIAGSWMVFIATGHASGEAARRLGDAQQVGAYDLIELLAPGLHGYTVPDVGTLGLTRCDNLYTGVIDRQGLAVYALAFGLDMPFDLPNEAGLGNFITFDAQLDIPPHSPESERREWIAGDYSHSNPDAHDTVTLPAP